MNLEEKVGKEPLKERQRVQPTCGLGPRSSRQTPEDKVVIGFEKSEI